MRPAIQVQQRHQFLKTPIQQSDRTWIRRINTLYMDLYHEKSLFVCLGTTAEYSWVLRHLVRNESHDHGSAWSVHMSGGRPFYGVGSGQNTDSA